MSYISAFYTVPCTFRRRGKVGEFLKYFSRFICNLQLNKELEFWKIHRKSPFFLLVWRDFCFSAEYFTHFVARERVLGC